MPEKLPCSKQCDKPANSANNASFSGVSTGACIGHVGPEALAGGPIGKVREGDVIRVVIDRNKLEGSVDFVGENGRQFSAEEGARILASRKSRQDLAPHSKLPDDTKLWATLQQISGGTLGGCVFDAEALLRERKKQVESTNVLTTV